jgi:hypothetical protein
MNSGTWYALAADAILMLHALFVAFVVLGLVLVLLGWLRDWRWVRNPWFRLLHVLAIVVVTLQAWLGLSCPLTVWEMALREQAGDAVYPGAFIAHWIELLLYYRAPPRVFIVAYTLFAFLVCAAWYLVPPSKFRGIQRDAAA